MLCASSPHQEFLGELRLKCADSGDVYLSRQFLFRLQGLPVLLFEI